MSNQSDEQKKSFLRLRIWPFIGRIGIALRRLLTLFIWKPFYFLTTPLRLLWRFLGRMGLAARNLLVLLLLEPLWMLTRPFLIPLYRFIGRIGLAIRTPLDWVYRAALQRPLTWLWNKISWFAYQRWLAAEPARRRQYRRLHSRLTVWRARWRVRLRRRKAPPTAVIAPQSPQSAAQAGRRIRMAAAVISVAIVLSVSFVSVQQRPPATASAERDGLPRLIVATPSPQPPTPSPEPTVPVRLTPWPTPDPLNKGGTLALTQHKNGNSDIYALPVGQAEPIRLTYHRAPDRQAAWSPDGQALAFASRREGNWDIYVYDLNMGTLNRLTDATGYDGNPSWSPDGEWLAYDSYNTNNLDIYIIKADGSEGPYRLTEHPALDYEPVWSASGRQIGFVSARSGNKDVFVMSLDAVSDSGAVNLTNTPALDETGPAYSPDGRYLAYSQSGVGLFPLYALPINESSGAMGEPISLGQQGQSPVWSPDSQSLIAVYRRGGADYLAAGSLNVWGVSPQLLAADGRLQDPSWSAVSLSPALAASLRPVDSVRGNLPLFTETTAEPEEGGAPVKLIELPINAPSPYLNDEVDQSFMALRQRIIDEAGWDFLGRLDNMFASLQNGGELGGDGRSWNQAGRAFDFYYRAALAFEPQIEIVPEEIDDQMYWRVYLRAEVQDGTMGEPLLNIPWDFQARYGDEPAYYEQGGKWKEAIPAGYYIDFTALAADYGWERVPSNENWRSYFPAIRFWHYENRQGLTWEQAMGQIYTASELSIEN